MLLAAKTKPRCPNRPIPAALARRILRSRLRRSPPGVALRRPGPGRLRCRLRRRLRCDLRRRLRCRLRRRPRVPPTSPPVEPPGRPRSVASGACLRWSLRWCPRWTLCPAEPPVVRCCPRLIRGTLRPCLVRGTSRPVRWTLRSRPIPKRSAGRLLGAPGVTPRYSTLVVAKATREGQSEASASGPARLTREPRSCLGGQP